MDTHTIQRLSEHDLLEKLHTSRSGLTDIEAKHRLEQNGLNELKNVSHRSVYDLLLKQFKSSLIYLLLAACIVSFALQDWNDGLVIAVILLINTGLGFFQEYKSEKAIENLQKLVSKEILVLREGKEILISEKTLVLGDFVTLRQGDVVPSDICIVSASNFSVDESQLTGESAAVKKVPHTTASDASIVYAGSTVESGEAKGVVFATAAKTELGKIAHLSVATRRITQYEQSLSSFSGFLIKMTLLALALVFLTKLIIVHDVSQISSLALFMVALSVAIVPEAMPVIATVTLSNGALKLARQHVVAKTLTAVEDLGNINILCSDKTGTITENKQTVKRLDAADPQLFQLLAIASLESLDEKRKKFQSSFDQAFLRFVPEAIQAHAQAFTRITELPFDPAARRRRVVCRSGDKTYLIVVGSAETLLALTHYEHAASCKAAIHTDSMQGLRHLAIAYKEVHVEDAETFDITAHEQGLHFVGYVALEDPLRSSAGRTIKLARSLGVEIKILSGDSREVTKYVATEVGLVTADQTVYIGDELADMSDLELAKVVSEHNAFARLTPEQKYRIIKLLKLGGNVVGYQGDGINDAPALKLADVAIAVNHATDVAQESADILLLRNDLHVIINGIQYGRSIFSNINKYIRYTMIGNFGNFFALSSLYLLSTSLPLLTTQLLLTNMLGDVPLVAVATDNVETANLSRPSKYNMHSLIFISAVLGSFTAIFEVLFYAIVRKESVAITQTSLYLYLTMLGFVVIMAVRNKDHFWKAPPFSRALAWAFGLIAMLSVIVIYVQPFQGIFSFIALPWKYIGLIGGMVVVYFICLDIIKVWFYKSTFIGQDQRKNV